MVNKGRKVGGDRHEEQVYGPSWYDVYILLKDLQLAWPDDGLYITLRTNTSINGRAGLRYDVVDNMGTIRGAGRYLDSDPTSSKTAAAAAHHALTRAWYSLEKRDENKEQNIIEL